MAGAVLRPAEGPLERKRAFLALLGLLVLGALLRVGAIFTVGDVSVLQGDEEYYVAHGFALARGEAYGDSMRAPLFPAFVAVVARLCGFSLTAVRLAQVPVSLLAVVFVFDLVRRRFGTRAGLLSGLFTALSPTLVHYTHFLWSETLFTTALLGSLWALDRWDASRRAGWLLAGGAFFGAAVMTREMILSFVAVVLVWLWRGEPLRCVRNGLLFAAPVALLVLPWTARNYALHHRFVLVSTMRWYPLAVGNQSGGRRAPQAGSSDFTRRYFSMTDELEREAFARATALGAIRDQQPLWIFKKAVRNTRKLFDLGGQLGRFAREGWLPPEKSRLAGRLDELESALYVLLMLIGLPALWLVPGGRTKTLVVGVILYFIAIHVVANSVTRFRVPLLPLFALYAGPLVLGHAARDGSRSWRLLAAAIALLVFLSVIVGCRPAPRSGDAPASAPAPDAEAKSRSVVLISIDTLRPDHLGCYRYSRETSPHIDALAQGGVLFENAVSTTTWTLPGHASMLTGLTPFRHGAREDGVRIRDDAPLVAELLKRRGFSTAAVINGPFVAGEFGFSRGFDSFVERYRDNRELPDYQPLVLQTLRSMKQEPFFFFAHYISVHSPYKPLAEFNKWATSRGVGIEGRNLRRLELELAAGQARLKSEERDHLVDLYDGEVLTIDHEIGEVLEVLRKEISKDALVILTADHGEEFLEHGGLLHGHRLYDEVLRVPLIVNGPGVTPGMRVSELTSLTDILPTLMEWVGGPAPSETEGVSLMGVLRGGSRAALRNRTLPLHTAAADGLVELWGLRTSNAKLIVDQKTGKREFYDLLADPRELTNLYPTRDAQLLERRLETLTLVPASGKRVTQDQGRLEVLRSLGYR